MPKLAILIDGAFFLKRLPKLQPNLGKRDPDVTVQAIDKLVKHHLEYLNKTYCVANPKSLLYRAFYYDAEPFAKKVHTPIRKKSIDYQKTDVAEFRRRLFENLRSRPNFAVRLGISDGDGSWALKPKVTRHSRPNSKASRSPHRFR